MDSVVTGTPGKYRVLPRKVSTYFACIMCTSMFPSLFKKFD
jgi:hypothetical protein